MKVLQIMLLSIITLILVSIVNFHSDSLAGSVGFLIGNITSVIFGIIMESKSCTNPKQ